MTLNYSDSLGNTAHASFQVIVSGFTVNDGSPQPSAATQLTYTFANPVQVKPGAFELLRNGRPSHIKLVLDEQPDQQDFLITFRGPGVVNGSLPDGSYTLITQHKKVKVLSGPPMTQNDVNKFVSRSANVHDGKKHGGASSKGSIGKMNPPRKAPARFHGRTVLHGATQIGSASGPTGGRQPCDAPGQTADLRDPSVAPPPRTAQLRAAGRTAPAGWLSRSPRVLPSRGHDAPTGGFSFHGPSPRRTAGPVDGGQAAMSITPPL